MSQPSSIFEYLYRDAGNFKTHGSVRLAGYDTEADAAIRLLLDWSSLFVAEQVGIPSLCRKHWASVGDGPSDLDHAFHEFVCLRAAGTGDSEVPSLGSLQAMLGRFQRASANWDVRISPNCDL